MRRTSSVIAALAVAGLAMTSQPALAGDVPGTVPDLSGRWSSAALRQDDVGYTMRLAAQCTPPTCYDVVLQMRFQDGTRGPRITAGMTVQGSRARLVLDGDGGLDGPNPSAMNGTIGMDGSLFFPTCYQQLASVTKADADTMCLFQEFAP